MLQSRYFDKSDVVFRVSLTVRLAAILLLMTAADRGSSQDLLRTDRAHVRLQFENASVRVLRLTLPGHGAGIAHGSPATLLVCINECHVRLQEPNGKIHDIHMDAGDTRWTASFARSERNLSDEPLDMLLIEFRDTAPARQRQFR
jgi:hypothetical protein